MLVIDIFKKQDTSTVTTEFRIWEPRKYGGTSNRMEVLGEDVSRICTPIECEGVPCGKIFYG